MHPFASVVVIEKLNVPLTDGAPPSNPPLESVIPFGNELPFATPKPYGEVPPDDDSCCEYAEPCVPLCSVVGLSVITGQDAFTVTVSSALADPAELDPVIV